MGNNSEQRLNSFNLTKDDFNLKEAMKVKEEWEKKRNKYWEIYYALNPKINK